ncbi:uncharacterized protein J3D65DRAFT_670124 [Phyllosticta citribraziliensis]|uniref:Uncharacterized protein n=1 Tax=Phyllosticta citribraziliensis TaxID=989973 RepID=A0ABR1LC86_9PEZI
MAMMPRHAPPSTNPTTPTNNALAPVSSCALAPMTAASSSSPITIATITTPAAAAAAATAPTSTSSTRRPTARVPTARCTRARRLVVDAVQAEEGAEDDDDGFDAGGFGHG